MQSMPIFTSELMERLHLYIRGGALKSCIHNLYSALSTKLQIRNYVTRSGTCIMSRDSTLHSPLEVFIPVPTWRQVDNIQLSP